MKRPATDKKRRACGACAMMMMGCICRLLPLMRAASWPGARGASCGALATRGVCSVVWCAHGMETAADVPAEAVLCAVVAHAGATPVSYTHLTLPTKRIV